MLVTDFLRSFRPLFLLLLALFVFTSCHYAREDDPWFSATGSRPDSADFRRTHHYWKGYNFISTDTFSLSFTVPFETGDLLRSSAPEPVGKGEILVVEDIRRSCTSEDSTTVWVKITAVEFSSLSADTFQPRHSSGWVTESRLRRATVPDTPVSKIIYFLGSPVFRLSLIPLAVALVLLLWFFRRCDMFRLRTPVSGYRNLLEAVLAMSVVLHRVIWHYAEEQWIEYYHHPTLLPFSSAHPLSIGIFVAAVWLLILLVIALMDDVFHSAFTLSQAVGMLIASSVRAVVVFTLFALVCPYWLMLPALFLFCLYLVRDYKIRRSGI